QEIEPRIGRKVSEFERPLSTRPIEKIEALIPVAQLKLNKSQFEGRNVFAAGSIFQIHQDAARFFDAAGLIEHMSQFAARGGAVRRELESTLTCRDRFIEFAPPRLHEAENPICSAEMGILFN